MNNYTIITFLKERRDQELPLEDVEKGTGIKISASTQLIQNLKENPSINYREDMSSGRKVVLLSWKSKYPITSRETLMTYLREHKLLEIDPEVKLTYKDIMTDLEQLNKEKHVFVIFVGKNKPIYFWNEAPHHKPMNEQVMQLWGRTFTEGTSDMVGIRQQLQHKYRVPLAQLPFDEDYFLLQQMKERKIREEKLKALRQRKGKGRSVGPNAKKKVNETLSDMNFSLTIADATDGADVFTLKHEQDDIIELNVKDEQGNVMQMPTVPEEICDFVQRMIRAFCDDESIVAFEALLREVSQEEANSVSINERKETLLAEKLHLSPRILRTILGRLKTQCFARERIFTLPAAESTRSAKQYSCWLITFNDLFDVIHYRILKMLEIMDSSTKDDSHYLYFCSNKACGRKYGIEDVGSLFGQQSCLDCQSELINAETNKKQDEWSDVRPVLEELRDQIRTTLLRSGSTMGNTPELANSSAASRRLPSSRQRKRGGGGPATPRTSGSSSSSTSTSSSTSGGKVENGGKNGGPVGPSMELVRKGEEKLVYDHPTPVQIARDGRIWLPVVYKTWVKKDPATARAREAKKDAVLATLLGEELDGAGSRNKRKSAEGKDATSTLKRPKTEDGMDLIPVKQEKLEAEEEEGSISLLNVKNEPSARVKEEGTGKLLMERTMSADEVRVDTEMGHREKRELGWDWSYSTKQAHNFLCHVGELRKYYSQVLEYEITNQSLYLAWKHLGITPVEVARRLAFLAGLKSPQDLPRSIMQTITACSPGPDGSMKNYYSVRLVLKDGEYYVESFSPSILNIIQQRVLGNVEMLSHTSVNEETGAEVMVYALPVATVQEVAEIKKLLLIHNHPFIEEFDFLTNRWSEKACANLAINLKEDTGVRPYQKRAAFSLFWDNKAHSSILVLPCGAGKTLVGITVSSIIKKCILVFCTSMMAVNQWREQFIKWSDIEPSRISRFISDTRKKGEWDHTCGLLITTYNMFTSEKRAEHSTRMIEKCKERTWGLMILDEVHLAPATTFKRVTTEFRAHVKLGLTATMVREDELIAELPTLVGPRLDEVDLLSLKIHNHVANVHCYRILCPLTPTFGSSYRVARSPAEKRLLHITNPNKARIVFTLLKRHLRRGHKCLVFCDDLFGLQWFSQVLGSPYIDGETKNEDREKALQQFRTTKSSAYVLISKVGDHSIDLPEANVVIQVGVVDGSRMQEAQRLGRVQRKKPGTDATAYFYTIVSEGTDEVGYSDRRREFMEEHGYLYHEYDYQLFMHAETEEFTREAKQESLLVAIRQEMEKNPEGRTEYSELDDKPVKREGAKKKGTTRSRLSKIVNKRMGGGREAKEESFD